MKNNIKLENNNIVITGLGMILLVGLLIGGTFASAYYYGKSHSS